MKKEFFSLEELLEDIMENPQDHDDPMELIEFMFGGLAEEMGMTVREFIEDNERELMKELALESEEEVIEKHMQRRKEMYKNLSPDDPSYKEVMKIEDQLLEKTLIKRAKALKLYDKIN